MPTYDYVCTKCGRAEERLVPIAMRDRQVCPCNYGLIRLVSAPPAISFRGTGWYVTDYKGKP